MALLTRISSQLSGDNVGNSTVLANESDSTFAATPLHIAINILWFSSLIITLNSALMAVTVKQWLAEYSWTIGSKVTSPHDTTILRQVRFEGLTTWGIPQIISYLPCQLVLSVFLFLAGLLCLLWDVHRAVAIPSTVLVSFAILCFLFTSIVPAFYPTCAYKSAQAWLAYRLLAQPAQALFQMSKSSKIKNRFQAQDSPRGWTDAAMQYLKDADAEEKYKRWVSYDAAALSWIYSSLVPWDLSLASTVWKCALGGSESSVQVVHSLVQSHLSYPLSSSEANISQNVADSKVTDLEKYSAAQILPSTKQLAESFELSMMRFLKIDMERESWSDSSHLNEKLYNTYLKVFNQPHGTSLSLDSLYEYILAFRPIHFHFLDRSKDRYRSITRSDIDKLCQGTQALAKSLSLLENTPMNTSFKRELQKIISDDLRKITLKNWRNIDVLAHDRLRSKTQRPSGKPCFITCDFF